MNLIKAFGFWLAGARPPKFEVFCGPSGKWSVRQKAGGRTVNVTETYASKSNAIRSAKRQAEKIPRATWAIVDK